MVVAHHNQPSPSGGGFFIGEISMGKLPDLSPLFYLAMIGLISLIFGGVGILAGIVYFFVYHVQVIGY